MKKVLAGLALASILVAGFFVTNDQPTNLAGDIEPSVFSISNSTF